MPMVSIEEPIRCAACGAQVVTTDPERRHHAPHNDETYTLCRCSSCDLQFWWPLKADPSVYESEGFEAYADYHSGARPFPRWAEPLFQSLPRDGGAVLDIGCGDGAVLDRLARLGFRSHGIDLDKKSIRVAREKYGLTGVAAQTLEEYAAECERNLLRFDLITFFEVLEHQDAPGDFLSQVSSLANGGCLIAGSVPNRNRFLARLDRRLSDGDLPPHHFLWFSEIALVRLLEGAGFENVSVTRVGALSFREISIKLRSIISRKAATWPKFMGWSRTALESFAPALAVVPWFGMRARPSHLFFKGQWPK